MLIKSGVIKRTENGAIQEDAGAPRVIAVENSIEAAGMLQEKYPGLKIVEKNIKDLIRGNGPIAWPGKDDIKCCRAAVVNLDLNEVLVTPDGVSFPLLDVVTKFITLHGKIKQAPLIDKWTLLLTVHAEIKCWDENVFHQIFTFLKENFDRETKFSNDCLGFLGASLHGKIINCQTTGISLSQIEQQKLLMVFVPKKIAASIHGQGWCVKTDKNMRYGGDTTAPMTTWVIDFEFKKGSK
jgi:hypothetical protein